MALYRDLPSEEMMPAVFHEWLHWLLLREGKPPNTIRAYSQAVRRIVTFAEMDPACFHQLFPAELDDEPVNQSLEIRQARLIDIVGEMLRSGNDADQRMSIATINQTLAALTSFYDYCAADFLVEGVPDVKRIRKIAKLDVDQVDPSYYRVKDLKRIYETAADGPDNGRRRVRWPTRDVAMIAFLAVLGLRASELVNADIDWIDRQRYAEQSERATWVMKVQGKGRRIRRLPLSPEIIEANERWQAERTERFGRIEEGAPLFLQNDGARFSYRRLLWWLHTVNEDAGVRDHSLHALRHTAGVTLASYGVPAHEIAKFMGHSSIVTTGIYTELVGGELITVLERSEANVLLDETLQKTAETR